MILSLALLCSARAGEPEEPEGSPPEASDEPADQPADEPADEPDDTLSRFRTPFEVLAERAIGTASTPVEFSWRRSRVQLAATGNHYFELNNFNTIRAGGAARIPTGGMLLELGLSYAWVWDTPSSELLALTPYRQPGHPRRLELDAMLGVPLAEGVVTTFPRVFPAVQLVFSAYGGLRYLIYPGGFEGMRFREAAGALLSPALTETEVANLDDVRLDAMQVDTGRYGLMAGFGNDIYFKQGLFVAPRALFAVPLLAPVSGTSLLLWADFSLAIGVAL